MATTLIHPESRTQSAPEPRKSASGGSSLLTLAGLAGIVLGILGLAGVLPGTLDGVGVLVLGLGLILSGGLLGDRILDARGRPAGQNYSPEPQETVLGFKAEVVFGILSAVLAIIALTSSVVINWIALGVIALGIAVWSGSATEIRLSDEMKAAGLSDQKILSRSAGLELMIGVGAVSLGVLSLYGVIPRLLTMISVIGIGVAIVLTGAVIARRMVPQSV